MIFFPGGRSRVLVLKVEFNQSCTWWMKCTYVCYSYVETNLNCKLLHSFYWKIEYKGYYTLFTIDIEYLVIICYCPHGKDNLLHIGILSKKRNQLLETKFSIIKPVI